MFQGNNTYQNVPIEIDCSKLIDWLVDRRHIRRDYQSDLNKLKTSLKTTCEILPEDKRQQVLDDEYLTYFNLQELMSELCVGEDTEKTLLGAYTSPVLKNLQSTLKAMEKNNLYMAESSLILSRLLVYEIPFARKQLAKLKTSQIELNKNAEVFAKKSEDALAGFSADCRRYGVAGCDLKRELMQLTAELDNIFVDCTAKCKDMGGLCEFYQKFAQSDVDLLKTLGCVVQQNPASSIEGAYVGGANRQDIEQGDSIDWGDEIEPTPPEIGESDEIDWGICVEPAVNEFDIEVVQSPVPVDHDSSIPGTEASLTNRNTRLMLLAELQEILCFLKVRQLESNSDGSYYSGKGDVSCEQVDQWVLQVEEIIEVLTNNKTRDLILMRNDDSYIEKIMDSLCSKKRQSGKMRGKADQCRIAMRENFSEDSRLHASKELLEQRANFIKDKIECSISNLYNKRPV